MDTGEQPEAKKGFFRRLPGFCGKVKAGCTGLMLHKPAWFSRRLRLPVIAAGFTVLQKQRTYRASEQR